MLVRDPAAGGPAVIEIQHRRHRIDPQAVDGITLQPEQRVRHQEIGHFGAAVIIDQRAPVEVAALQRIGVFVQRGAVEMAEAMRIVGEMPGHPIQQHADAFAMKGIDQCGEVFGRPEPAGRRVHAGGLIAPRAVERMLVDRHEFDMGKAEVADVAGELLRQIAIGQPFIVVLAPPRAEMDLVDRHRRAQRIDVGRRRSWLRQLGLVENDRGRAWAYLRGKRQRVGFQRQMLAVRSDDIEFIAIARLGVGDEQLPIADAAHPHRMPPGIPEIEIADHADPLRVGRQHHEGDAIDAIERHRMRAKLVVNPLMGAFAEQIKVEVGQYGRKAVGVVEFDDVVAEAGAQLVALGAVRQRAGEQAGVVDTRQFRRFAVLVDGIDIRRLRQERTHDGLVVFGMQAEIMKGSA